MPHTHRHCPECQRKIAFVYGFSEYCMVSDACCHCGTKFIGTYVSKETDLPASRPPNPDFASLLSEMSSLHNAKNHDYAAEGYYDNFLYAANLVHGFENDVDKVFAAIIGIKLARLMSLKREGKKGNFESVEDTHKDLATYCTIWAAWERSKKNEPKV